MRSTNLYTEHSMSGIVLSCLTRMDLRETLLDKWQATICMVGSLRQRNASLAPDVPRRRMNGESWRQFPCRFCGGGEGRACWRGTLQPSNRGCGSGLFPTTKGRVPDHLDPFLLLVRELGSQRNIKIGGCWSTDGWDVLHSEEETEVWSASANYCNRLLLTITIIFFYFIIRINCLGGVIKVGCPQRSILHHKNTSVSGITDQDKAQSGKCCCWYKV